MSTYSFRALYPTGLDRLFAIVGSDLWEIFSDKSTTLRGQLNSNIGMCSIAENETQLFILDGNDGYIYNLVANTLTKIINYNDMVDTVGISASGSGYAIGDLLYLPTPTNGAQAILTVSSISNTGGVTDASVKTKGRGYSNTSYATTTNGSGSGCAINVETLADGGFKSGSHVVNIDGFFVKTNSDSGQFQWSYLRDGSTWDALDFATAEGSPDNLVSIGKINNELWLFGTKTTEIWYDTGDYVNGEFRRINQGYVDIGCAAEWSVASIGNIIFWLGADTVGHGIVWMANNYIPQRISTHAIEYIIGQISKTSTISDAVAFCYQEEGHQFYQLTFPSGNKTIVFDLKNNMWHERGYWNSFKGKMERHKAQCFAFWKGKNYVGDYQNSNLYEYDLDTFTDNGDFIRRIRTGPHFRQDRKRLFHREFELDVERGVGLTDGHGSKPILMLSTSDDGGQTWSNERPLNIGKIGKYKARAHTHRLGMSRDRVYRVTCSDPVKTVLVSARADIEMGGN